MRFGRAGDVCTPGEETVGGPIEQTADRSGHCRGQRASGQDGVVVAPAHHCASSSQCGVTRDSRSTALVGSSKRRESAAALTLLYALEVQDRTGLYAATRRRQGLPSSPVPLSVHESLCGPPGPTFHNARCWRSDGSGAACARLPGGVAKVSDFTAFVPALRRAQPPGNKQAAWT
jgi:hypothetical protein